MDWRDEYKRKFVAPDEAVRVIKSGDRLGIPIETEPLALVSALVARAKRGEIRDIKLSMRSTDVDLGLSEPGLDQAIEVTLDTTVGVWRQLLDARKIDYMPSLTSRRLKAELEGRADGRPFDVVFIVVSPPDKNGFCSFGIFLSHKKSYTRASKKVIAEVKESPDMMVKTFGDNYIHISQIDYFVNHVTPPRKANPKAEIEDSARRIAEYVKEIIQDGDTIQHGPGSAVGPLPELGVFNSKRDLGIHSPLINSGLMRVIRDSDVFTGRRKTLNPEKHVTGSFDIARRGLRDEDQELLDYIDGNPSFLLKELPYVNDPLNIAANDNMIAVNNAISVDLTGQICSDSIGTRMWGGAGGQVDFAIGAFLAKGGKSITLLPSTASKGKISRIVPLLEKGTIVSVPRSFADYIVTEYGIARMLGRSQRERAEQLASIAHSDFRAELRREAEKLYWP